MDDTVPQKQCTGECKQWYPATPEFFPRHKRHKDGLDTRCKVCISKRKKAYRSRPEVKEHETTYKREYGQRPEYRARKNARRNLARKRPEIGQREREKDRERYKRPETRERIKIYHKAYYKRPEVRAHVQAYRQRPEVKERARLRRRSPEWREWNRRNKHRRYHNETGFRTKRIADSKAYYHRQGTREKIRAYHATPEGRAKLRSNWRRQRVLKRSISGNHTYAQINDLLKRQKYTCYYCSARFKKTQSGYTYHVDHTFPLSRVSGTDIPANDINYLVLACPTCNMKKHDKYPWEFPEGGRLL